MKENHTILSQWGYLTYKLDLDWQMLKYHIISTYKNICV